MTSHEGMLWLENHSTMKEQDIWELCNRGDWMLWAIAAQGESGFARRTLVSAACECARMNLIGCSDSRAIKCIETVEAWIKGKATEKQVIREQLNSATCLPRFQAASYAAYAAHAGYSSVYPHYIAKSANPGIAPEETLRACSFIVRDHFPKFPKLLA